MRWPFVSASRYDDLLREKNSQLGERDKRISDLEAERKVLLDRLSEVTTGSTIYSKPAPPAALPETDTAKEPPSEVIPIVRRPSQAVAEADRIFRRRQLERLYPNQRKDKEMQEVVLRSFDVADMEARQAAAANKSS
jgi:hypothetical protein